MSNQQLSEKLEIAARWIAEADGILIAAGAGMGVDSGLPDFRGKDGFWRAYPSLKAARINFEQIANPRAFRYRPEQAWGFYGHRLELYRSAEPHEGFHIIRRWAESKPNGCRVFTSNVDGQFQRAGFPDSDVYECHGSIHWLQCSRLCGAPLALAEQLKVTIDAGSGRWVGPLPTCVQCGAVQRPAVLMFNDSLWESGPFEGRYPGLQRWLHQVQRLVVIEVGAGLAIPTVRRFAESASVTGNLVRINQREAEAVGHHAVGIELGALAALSSMSKLAV